MHDLIDYIDLLPPGLRDDEEALRLAKVFEPGDPLPWAAPAYDLRHPERGVFETERAAPRVPEGSLIVTSASMRSALWRRLTSQPGERDSVY